MGQLKNISVRHDQIMDWLIANPTQPLSACAAHFQLTQPWLSTIIHSDLFQAKLTERKDEVFGEVCISVKDRITALAHDSLRRLQERVNVEDNVPVLVDASDLALKALGFGPRQAAAQGGTTVNVYGVDRGILAEARARMERGNAPEVTDATDATVVSTQEPAQLPQSITEAETLTE